MEYENKLQESREPYRAPKAEPKPAKPTQDQLITLLRAMVAEAEAAGQRDRPHVAEAKRALDCCEPDESEERSRAARVEEQRRLAQQAQVRADRD